MIIFKRIIFALIFFISLNSYGLNVDNYYENTSNQYFNYFYPKLFQDSGLGIEKSNSEDKKLFDEIFKIWLLQTNSWSFYKDKSKIYYLNLFYKINGKQKNLQEITLCFNDTKKITDFLKTKKNLKLKSQDLNSFGIKFSQSLKIISYVNKSNEVRRPDVKNYEIFPDYLFYSNVEIFEFFFKDWRIPIESIVFENKKPMGFYVP